VDRQTSGRSIHRDESVQYPRRSTNSTTTGSEQQHVTDKEVSRRIRDRWLSDTNDEPSVGHDSLDEKDRVLVDNFHPKYVLPTYTVNVTDNFAQVSAQRNVSLPRRQLSAAYDRPHDLYAVI
jgi:hypothetical protein